MFKNKKILIIIILAVVLFFVYACPYFELRPQTDTGEMWIFNTPDEMANYFFIANFNNNSELKVSEPLNNLVGSLNIVHPRSMQVASGNLVPGNFLGFILILGWLAKIFGLASVPFIIPFFSLLAIICFYLILKSFFEEKIAFWSALLLMILPAFWYYSSRSLFNNVLFLDFLIIGFYLLVRFSNKKNVVNLVVAGLLIGSALTMRTADLAWVGLLLILFCWFRRREIGWPYWLLLIVLIFVPFLPILFYQLQLYGGALATGYSLKAQAVGSFWLLHTAQKFLLPFGFSLKNIFYNFYFYFIKMFWWYFWPGLLGGLTLIYQWLKGRLTLEKKRYFVLFVLVSLFILLYYGSWFFFNNLMGKALIGSSQTRYLLPIYILSLPLAVYGFDKVLQFIKIIYLKKIIFLLIAVIMIFFSVRVVWTSGEESLGSVIKTVKSYQQINKEVRRLTENNAIIVSSYNDKVFFPQRKVIYYWQEPQFLASISLFMKEAPVYLYSINGPADENYIKSNSQLKLELVKKINASETLYKLTN
ncbi:MAG: glycosyltransferase family 39 protein [Patescibacteria group bacterium]